jgi:hypothetical protein
MANYSELMAQLRAAHAKGDTNAAKSLAAQARAAKAEASGPRPSPVPDEALTPAAPKDMPASGFVQQIAAMMVPQPTNRPMVPVEAGDTYKPDMPFDPRALPQTSAKGVIPAAQIGRAPEPSVVQGAPSIPKPEPIAPIAQATTQNGPIPQGVRGPEVERQIANGGPGYWADYQAIVPQGPVTQSPAAQIAAAMGGYTPLGEAIIAELGNTPERLERGFRGNALAANERGIVINYDKIGQAKQAQGRLAEIQARKAEIQAAVDKTDLFSMQNAEAQLQALAQEEQRLGQLAHEPGYADAVIDRSRALIPDMQRGRSAQQTAIDALSKAMTPTNPAPGLDQALVSGISSFGDMAPGIAASLVTQNPIPMMAYLGAYSRGSAYADKRAEGFSSDKSLNAANLYAAAEAIPEILPLHVILKEGSGALMKVAGGAMTEAASEALTQALQIMVDKGVLDQNTTWGEAVAQMQQAAAAGGVMGLMMGGAGVGVGAVRDRARRREEKKGTPSDPNAILPRQPVTAPSVNPNTAPSPISDIAQAMQTDTRAAPPDEAAGPVAPVKAPTPQKPESSQTITRAEAEANPDRYEILPAAEGQGTGWREADGEVAFDKETGQAINIAPQTTAAPPPAAVSAAGDRDSAGTPQAPTIQGPVVEPAAGADQGPISQITASMQAPKPETDAQPSRPNNMPDNIEFIDAQGVQSIGTEPGVMQYKAGGDENGVNDRLKGVKEWRPERAGMAIIYEYADGRRVIADGHQRLGLAKRLSSEGKPVQMFAQILRQKDGVTPQEARATAALKNIAEGSGTAVDAAKVLRDTNQTADQLGLPPSSALVRDALGMRNLSNDAFGMVVNGISSERDGGIVGRLVQDKAAQANILGLLNRLKPANAFQAETIVKQAAADTTTETQDSLFGPETDTQNLYLERAKILDAASKLTREEMRAFKTVTDNADRLQSAGNVLDADGNQQRLDSASSLRDYLQSGANTKGPISDALTAAARSLKSGAKPGAAVKQFLDAIERELGAGGAERPSSNQSGQADQGQPDQVKTTPEADLLAAMMPPKAPAQADVNKSDADALGSLFPIEATPAGQQSVIPGTERDSAQADQAKADKDKAELEARIKQSKMRKLGGNNGGAGPLFGNDDDLFSQPAKSPESHKTTVEDLERRKAELLEPFVGRYSAPKSRAEQKVPPAAYNDLMQAIASADTVQGRFDAADRWVVAQGKATMREHLVIFSKDGVPVGVSRGYESTVQKGHGVSPSTDVLAYVAAKGTGYATHNHPANSGVSPGDIMTLAMGFGNIAAVGHNGQKHNALRGENMPELVALTNDGAEIDRSLSFKAAINAVDGMVARLFSDHYYAHGEVATRPATRAALNLVMHRIGVIVYDGNAESIIAETGVDFDAFYTANLPAIIAAFRRNGFPVHEISGAGGNRPGASTDGNAGPAKPEGAQAGPTASDAGTGTGVTPKGSGDADFDAAMDALFGKDDGNVSGPGDNLERDSGDAGTPNNLGAGNVPPATGGDGRGNSGGTRAGGGRDGQPDTSSGLSGGNAPPLGADGDSGVSGRGGSGRKPATGGKPRASNGGSGGGLSSKRSGKSNSAGNATNQADITHSDVQLFGKLFGEAGALFRESASVAALYEDATGIDQQKYDALKPMFDRRLDGVDTESTPRQQVFMEMMKPLIDAGVTRSQMLSAKPYFDHYLSERAAGRTQSPPPKQKPIEADNRAKVQAEADKVRVKYADRDNIDATLPLLLPEQRDDVFKIETRFAKPDGHGMMLTNGTGTGKTYSGGGVVKRFVQQGKGNILIVAPSDAVIAGWTAALNALGVEVNQLADVKDAGRGVTITTYANMEQNNNIANRDWDLIVTDEAQHLSSNKDGKPTGALTAMRAISNKPEALAQKSRMIHADDWVRFAALPDGDAKTATYRRLIEREKADIARFAAKPRSKVLFLSATPFAYDKSIEYAEGYLFNYPKDGHVGNSRQGGREIFMTQNFGYRIRYHKLTRPEAAVDSAVFEREFHEKLKRDGVLSGRSLQVDVDYDRKFVVVADAIGTKIDTVLKDISEGSYGADKELADGYRTISKAIGKIFNRLARMQLLEAIKAKAAVDDIRKHLALGRKVVVFHDFNVGGGFNPFSKLPLLDDANAIKALADLMQKHPDLDSLDFSTYAAPVVTLSNAFGDRARLFNGRVPKAKRLMHLADFNTDGSGADVLIVQADAGGAGISMHDISGSHQRVMINLGMPSKPTTTLQQEGRTLRVGTVTDAAFRYYTIGTGWERQAFAKQIAERSGTVENLALGNQARAITDGFIDAYMEAEPIEPSDQDGKGGKERDRRDNTISPWQKAITHYYGRAKMKGRRDQREGLDFYPTPEPLGLKMVQWAGIRSNERVLEPSAGDGSIARYMPDDASVTMVEPSDDLGSTALLRNPRASHVASTFENYHIVNKHHVIVMNPPFGVGGKTAMEHLAKAAKHVRLGGRIVALIPTGPAADKRFEAWWHGDDAKEFSFRATINLPAVAFERAGTSVMSRIVVLDRLDKEDSAQVLGMSSTIDLTHIQTTKELFDRIENLDIRLRPAAKQDVVDELEAEGEDATTPVKAPKLKAPLAASVGAITKTTVQSKAGKIFPSAYHAAKVERDVYDRMSTAAKALGGWWHKNAGTPRGAGPTFAFRTEANRDAFIEDMNKPVAGMEETAYHGTPHDFDQFSLDAIGTGEGAQAFGWGLYFAGRRAVSEWYRNTLAKRKIMLDGEEVPETMRTSYLSAAASADWDAFAAKHQFDLLQDDIAFEVSPSEWRDAKALYPISLKSMFLHIRGDIEGGGWALADRLERARQDELAKVARVSHLPHYLSEVVARLAAIKTFKAAASESNTGRLFTVDIPGPENLLDYNARINDQPERVKTALRDLVPQLFDTGEPSQWAEEPETPVTRRAWRDQFGWQIVDFDGYFAVNSPARKINGGKTVSENKRLSDAKKSAESARKFYAGDQVGSDAYRILSAERGGDRAASLALRKLGIPGHRYLDGSSRSAGEGSHNYVIYDDAAIKIVEKQQRAQMVREAAASTEEVARIMPDLRAELDRLNLKRVSLASDAGAGWQGAFQITGDGGMEILIGASLNPQKTLYHEAIHAMRAMNLFSDGEWQALTQAAEKSWIAKHDIAERYPDLTQAERIEEAIAEEFSEALAAKKSPNGSAIVAAFNKIARLLRALRSVFTGKGYATPEAIFGAVLSGEIGARQAGNTGGNAGARIQYQRQPRAVRPLTAQGRAHRNSGMGGSLFLPDRRVWETLTQANATIWQRLRQTPSAASDAVDRARVHIQDRFLPIMRAQDVIERVSGRPLPAEQNAYVMETTFSGKVGRHNFEIDEEFTKPIIQIIAKSKGAMTSDSVGEWLYARHAIERNAYIAGINPQMPDGGSGMLDADAQMILQDAAASPNAADYLQIGAMIDALRERNLRLREDAGLISHDDARAWRRQYKHYVPLKGFEETDHADAVMDVSGVGRRFNIRGGEAKRALGRKSEAFNPLQSAITQAQEVAIRAEKNRVGKALYDLAKNHPSNALWKVKTPKQKRYFNRTTGLVETRVENPVSMVLEPNEMAVKIGGQEHRILFMDDRLARAAGTIGADQMSGIIRALSHFSRFFSMTRTMLNPEFMITNAFRDIQTAQFNIQAFGEADKNRIAKAMVKNWRKAFLGAMRGSTYKFDTEWSKYYAEFQKAGAQVSFWVMENPEVARRDLDKRISLARGSRAQRALKVVTTPSAFFSMRDNAALEFIERVNLGVDNAVRLAAFVEARKAGWPVEKAAFMAKELTVNFNRRGEGSSTLNALYPFFNAAVQGSVRTVKAVTSKRVAKMVLVATAAGLLNDLLNAALSEEDEDGELFYDKIPNWRSERNFHMVLWGTGETNFSIPMPYGYNIFPYAGQQLGKVMRGVKQADDAFSDVAVALFGAFSPISSATPAQMVSPFISDPLVEMAENKNWVGIPIYPRYKDESQPDAYWHNSSATEVSKWVAQTVNGMTGGDFRQSGAVDVSPETLDHLSQFIVGSAGAFYGRSLDTLGKALSGNLDEIEVKDVPFARSVLSSVNDRNDMNRYYTFKGEVADAQKDAKAYIAAGQPVPKRTARLASLYESVLKAERERKGQGEFNVSRGGTAPRPEPKVVLDFNKQFLKAMGKQGE